MNYRLRLSIRDTVPIALLASIVFPAYTPALSASTHPNCTSAASDSDGDGWGWENNASCIVVPTQQTTEQTTTTPANSSRHPLCTNGNSDPDGDGWGWENNASCIVSTDSGRSQNDDENSEEAQDDSAQAAPPPVGAASAGSTNGRPICLTDTSDVDNSGFGYENGTTCVVVSGVTGTRNDPLLNQRICTPWQEISYGNYRLQNNVWNANAVYSDDWSQCIELTGSAGRPVAQWDYNWLPRTGGNEYSVKSYPQVYYGRKTRYNLSGTVAQTGLPANINSLPQFQVDFAYSETGNAERNVAFESFFHTSCEAEQNNKHFEMMVWVGKPDVRTPGPPVGTATIDGREWDVFINPSLGWGYVAYVAQTPMTSGTLNWNAFVEWTRDSAPAFGVPAIGNTCMGAIELGTETFWGSGTFRLDRFNVRRN